jgi:hypothetical protein
MDPIYLSMVVQGGLGSHGIALKCNGSVLAIAQNPFTFSKQHYERIIIT